MQYLAHIVTHVTFVIEIHILLSSCLNHILQYRPYQVQKSNATQAETMNN